MLSRRFKTRSFASFISVVVALVCTTSGLRAQSVMLAPSTVDFGTQLVGTTGAAWTLTVNNTGPAQVALGTISLSDTTDFVVSTTCGAVLGGYSNCNVMVGFSPSTSGTISGQLLVPVVGTTIPLSVALTGNGVAAVVSAPSPNFTPGTINFGSQTLSTSSSSFSASLNNSGPGALNITSLTVSDPADFSLTSNCGTQLAGYSNCQVLVVFTPSTVGPIAGSIQLLSNGNPQTMSLQGNGTAVTTSVVVAPAAIDFGSQTVGLTGNFQTITVNNTGPNTIALTNFQVGGSGAFSIVNNGCGTTLAGNSTCDVPVAFTAATTGIVTGQLTFSANGTAESVPLQGAGISSAPTLFISPSTVDFGTVVAGTTAGPWTISVNNTSASAASLSQALTVSGSSAFTFTSNCGNVIAAHASCNVVVTFAPKTSGPYGAQISLQVSGASGPQPITLVGNATPSAPVLLIAPSAVDFGTVQTGTKASAWTLSVSNPTGGVVNFGAPITVAGSREFTISTTCGTSLAAYSSCQILVSFLPVIHEPVHGQVVVTVAGGSTQTVSLAGYGAGPSVTPTVSISPEVYDFGSQQLGSATPNVSFTVTNAGSTDAYFSSNISVTGSPEFVLSQNGCSNPIQAGTSCSVSINFNPVVNGTATGELLLPFVGLTDPLVVGLNGTGGPPAKLAITPASFSFGVQSIGSASAAQSFTLTNPSAAAIPFTLGALPSGYSATTSCSMSVSAYSSCNLIVVFTPTVLGAQPGVLSVGENGQLAVDQISFTGVGAGVTISPSSFDFGSSPLFAALTPDQKFTISPAGPGGPKIASITSTGPFPVLNGGVCVAQVSAGNSCYQHVQFLPTTIGSFTGQLIVTFVGGATQTVNLAGTGTTPLNFTFSPAPGSTTPNTTAGQTYAQTLTLTNSGPQVNLNIGVLTSTNGGWKIVSTTCGPSIASNATCSLSLAFTPTVAGTDNATLVFTDATYNWPYTWTMAGQGVAASTSVLVASPTSIKFQDFDRNAPDDWVYLVPITITNPTAAVVAFSANTGDPDFIVIDEDGTCGINNLGQYQLPAGGHCSLGALYYLGTLFPRDGQVSSFVSFTTTGGSTTSVAVSAYSPYGDDLNKPRISVSTNALVFAAAPYGSASPVQTITITNNSGDGDSIWVAPNWNGSPTGPAFQIAQNSCNTTIAPHATCTVGVVFTPNQSGPITNFLQFEDNSTNATLTVSLLGTGYASNGFAVPITGSYNLQAYPGDLTLSSGQSGTAQFTLTPVGGFKGTVTLSCGPLPTGVTCTFAPPTLTADGSIKVLTSTLTVSTVGIHGDAKGASGASFGLLATVSLLGMGFARRRFRVGVLPLAMSLVLAALAAGSTGCGAGLSSLTTPTGASTVLVKATSVVNGSTAVEQYASFKLTIN